MGKSYKIVVTGPFNAGKSEFIRTVSDIPMVSTDKKITDELAQVKKSTTVAMDYGQVTVEDALFHLYGTPGQERFEFMWNILAREMDGLLLLVDSTDRYAFSVARRILRQFRRRSKAPFRVVATKQDKSGAVSAEKVAKRLRVKSGDVILCDPRRKSSAKDVLRQLHALL